eukprot:g25772.t1
MFTRRGVAADGSPVPSRVDGGMTPLHAAALSGNSELVRSLLEYRAPLATNDHGTLPHELAEACGHTHLLPLLETFYT